MSAPLVAFDDVQVRWSDRFQLHADRISFGRGLTVIVGHNGGGKSTLLKLVATLITPHHGRVTIGGADTRDDQRVTAVRANLGYAPQDDSTPPRLRSFDHLDVVAAERNIGSNRRARHAAVAVAMRNTDIAHLAGQRCGTLSGGERRRVALAAAFVGDAELLVLDEPDTGLDDEQRRRLTDQIQHHAQRATIVVSTHDHQWAEALIDRIPATSIVSVDQGVVTRR